MQAELFPMGNAIAVGFQPELFLILQRNMTESEFLYGQAEYKKQAEAQL